MRGVTTPLVNNIIKVTISTHTPHARRDLLDTVERRLSFAFQLTRLMRGVTFAVDVLKWHDKISTHTPHARRDTKAIIRTIRIFIFQLTRLMRGVTRI